MSVCNVAKQTTQARRDKGPCICINPICSCPTTFELIHARAQPENSPFYFSVAWDMMYSDRAVIVRLGLTPKLAAITEPSATYRFG